ncbi:hypothetical protein AB0K11_05470 [Mycobacterium sp. NPDC050551]|uniref:hypothetical protein n=1 Tax=Mycobacterium sp. NPDC050551 TaxID=3155407 RepID=UPI00342448B4
MSIDSFTYPLAIIGGGPAGLAAAVSAAKMKPIVVDAGPALSDRVKDDPQTVVSGVGGAGLYSDGKFSFWPSATGLWKLRSDYLHVAYEWLRRVLGDVGTDAPDLPTALDIPDYRLVKKYDSKYVSQVKREKIIGSLAGEVPNFSLGSRVDSVCWADRAWKLTFKDQRVIYADRILIATGRFGPAFMSDWLPRDAWRALRLEVGIRIEQHNNAFFLDAVNQTDPKFIFRDDLSGTEWRTFCCCRSGRVIKTAIGGLTTASGRADAPFTEYSNVGFNVRITDPTAAEPLWLSLRQRIESAGELAQQPLAEFAMTGRGPLADVFGDELTESLRHGIGRLVGHFGSSVLADATAIGPALEGVVFYPRHTDSLAVEHAPHVWVAGDAAGTFRGLTAALLSGYVAGLAIARTEFS